MKVTIKDIALVAGVSHSTVSRALNDSPQISKITKEKIKNIAKLMNFEFNAGARSLSGRRTGNIGVVYEARSDQFGSSLYINQLFVEVRLILEKMGMDAIILEGYHYETGKSNVERLLKQQKVDGFLIVHDYISRKDYLSIKEAGLPIVQLHMVPKYFKSEQLDSFFTDHRHGGEIATEHLIKCGCKTILTVLPIDQDSDEYKQRTLGYRNALEKNGIPFDEELVVSIDSTYLKGYNLFNIIPEVLNRIDGIFFQTDIQAFGFLNSAKERGIRIPEDIKVIGYDDAPICDSTHPKLSTIHQPRKELAKLSCERIEELFKNKENQNPVQKVLLPTLVLRDSC